MTNALAISQNFASWDDVRAFLVEAPYHQEVVIAKAALPDPKDLGAKVSIGIPRGQSGDLRFPPDAACQGMHVQNFGDYWHVHLDIVHPTCDLLGHLRADAPRLGAYGALAGIGAIVGGVYEGKRGALIGVVGGVLVGAVFDFAAACVNTKNPVKP